MNLKEFSDLVRTMREAQKEHANVKDFDRREKTRARNKMERIEFQVDEQVKQYGWHPELTR